MVQYGCACGEIFSGKNGQHKLGVHLAQRKTDKCSPRNRTYYNSVKSTEKKAA